MPRFERGLLERKIIRCVYCGYGEFVTDSESRALARMTDHERGCDKRPVQSAVTYESNIVRDMKACARELGIVDRLLDANVFLRDGDPVPAGECIREALRRLGVTDELIAKHSANNRPATHEYKTEGVPPCACGHRWRDHFMSTSDRMTGHCLVKGCECGRYRRAR